MDEHLTSVSLRRLAVFLTVCETLHVARAAEKLDIAQPALSQQIKALEEALGLAPFLVQHGFDDPAGFRFGEPTTTQETFPILVGFRNECPTRGLNARNE
ncbi:MAG: LysR family transcriptional regulator [Komagataeibacter hansenii]|nr:LysR family transcriptional regulator [Novacetimonas hansenii]